MNHSITVGGLLLSVMILAGILSTGFGALMFFAAGMSDATDDGTGGQGCVVFVIGTLLIVGGILGLLL